MKSFTKVFILSFFCFFIAIYLGSVTYLKENNLDIEENIGLGFYEKNDITKSLLTSLEVKPKEDKSFQSLEEAKVNSSRTNFLIVGMEDVRTDSILLASFSRDSKDLDVISIPRDTYIHRKNHNSGEERKINSVYNDHGIDGLKQTISYILDDIPIHHYIMMDYEGVKSIVDLLGGVEVDVPFHMKYIDPTANPPLNIDIKQGTQILDGDNALNFIRWRKDNKNKGYIDGDLGRIKAQQKLLTSLAGKATDNILDVVVKGFKYVKSDIGLIQGFSYGRSAIGIKNSNIKFQTLPGKSDMRAINKKVYSYYIYNQKEVKNMLEEIYNVKK